MVIIKKILEWLLNIVIIIIGLPISVVVAILYFFFVYFRYTIAAALILILLNVTESDFYKYVGGLATLISVIFVIISVTKKK